MYDDENYIMEALEIGVEGYILKMSEVEKVIAAIKLINEGETYFDPKITRSITERSKGFKNQKQPDDLLRKYDLTSREMEIINYTINGLSTKQIAEKLFISPNTVYNHRRNIFHKLKINRSSELISFAINNNLFLISGK
jgi:DNA-binding NarL/FixJ family response regulator